MSRVLAGVFVGGRGTRMGGVPKGLMRTPEGTTIAQRLHQLLVASGAEVVLVGASEAYASMGLESLPDEPPGVGPLGGLASLLRRAGGAPAIAIACDMPYVSAALVTRLVAAAPAPIVAPRRDGRWEPLCARYDATRVLPVVERLLADGRHALQALLDEAGAVALALSADEALELRDWDVPADVVGPAS